MDVLTSIPWAYVLPVLISVILIRLFYKAFKNTWPELYFSVSDYASLFISFSPLRYFGFTLLPTLIISAFVLSFSLRNYHVRDLPELGLLIGLIHSLSTNGLTFLKLATNDKTVQTFYNKYFQMFVHIISIVAIAGSGYMGGFLGEQKFIVPLIPTWGVIDNLWAALFSSILTVLILKMYTNKYTDEYTVIEKSKKTLPVELIEHVYKVCEQNHAKRELVLAVCVTENIQRPAWVRRLEHIKSFVFRSGTYGIMQVASKKFVSDFGSVEIAVKKYFSGTEYLVFGDDTLKDLLSKYNDDSKFIRFATAAYYDLQPKG